MAAPVVNPVYKALPLCQIRLRGIEPQLPADHPGKVGFFQHQGGFVQVGEGDIFKYAVGLYIAEQGNLVENPLLQRLIAPQHDDIRVHTQAPQLLHGVLGGLGLVLVGAPEEGHQGHMDEKAVFPAHLQANLPHRLQEGLGLNVAGGAADFRNHHVRIRLLSHPVDKLLDLPGNVGNHLDGGAQVLTLALLVQHIPIHPSGGEVGEAIEIFVDETLIVAQIQVRLRTVLGDKHLAVLVGAHGARVHIDIGVQLLGRYLQASGFQQPSQGGCGNALAQAGHHAAGYKNILGHTCPAFLIR